MTQPTSDKSLTDTKLTEVIVELIVAKENELDYSLMKADYDFLIRTMENTVRLAIHKFIAGGKEHNPDHDELSFVDGVKHLEQNRDETIDQIFYGAGALENARRK